MHDHRHSQGTEEVIFGLRRMLAQRPKTAAGIMMSRRVAWVPKGPSGDQELLVLVFADDPSLRYWYAQVRLHPNSGRYVALLVDSHVFIDGKSASLAIQRFSYWIAEKGCFTPATIQGSQDAYAEAKTWQGALECLADMIRRFDIRHRTGRPSHQPDDRPIEMRIFDIYPIHDVQAHSCGDSLPPGVRELYEAEDNNVNSD